ncbi:hypothetical protein AO52_03484, partial [Mycobacterium tuberculosis M1928]
MGSGSRERIVEVF